MKRWFILIAVLAMIAVACGDDDSAPMTTEETGSTEPDDSGSGVASGVPSDLAITEVVFGDHVTITNLGTDAVSVDGLWVCNRPNYAPLPTSVIAPGASLEIAANGLGGLSAGGGEVALYTSNSFGDSGAIVDYVGWAGGGGRGSVAADAGLWPAGDSVTASGSSIAAASGGSSAADWSSP